MVLPPFCHRIRRCSPRIRLIQRSFAERGDCSIFLTKAFRSPASNRDHYPSWDTILPRLETLSNPAVAVRGRLQQFRCNSARGGVTEERARLLSSGSANYHGKSCKQNQYPFGYVCCDERVVGRASRYHFLNVYRQPICSPREPGYRQQNACNDQEFVHLTSAQRIGILVIYP